MRFFLIDSENVQQYNFIDELQLDSNDKLIMFLSDKSKNIKAEDLKRFTLCKANIEFEDVSTGDRNALDFQLIAHLSLLVATNKNDIFYIVSNDKDFNAPCEYLKNKTGVDLSILKTDINSRQPSVLDEVATTVDNPTEVNDLDDNLVSIMKDAKDLCTLHNLLKNAYGDENGRNIYMQIKSIYKSGSF